jgi:hypothetical protein
LTGENISDVIVESITLDGNKENNNNLDGNYAGCVFLQDCQRVGLRNVEARNYNGDGISWQICHDVTADNCYSHDNTGLGLHPGSGSQRPRILDCRMERNSQGLFWCWGVKFGLAERNVLRDNRDYGMSIGHNDTDNVMRDNEIIGSGKVGILFRNETRGVDFWANRNRVENNRIINSGGPDGIAIDVQGQTKDVVISGNTIDEQREPAARIGIRVSAEARNIALSSNSIRGVAVPIQDLGSVVR